jgi:hypothetical protein
MEATSERPRRPRRADADKVLEVGDCHVPEPGVVEPLSDREGSGELVGGAEAIPSIGP